MPSKYLSHFPIPIASSNKTESKKPKKKKRKTFALVSRNKLASYEKKRECKSQTNKIQFLAFIINTEDKVLAQKNTLWLKTHNPKRLLAMSMVKMVLYYS